MVVLGGCVGESVWVLHTCESGGLVGQPSKGVWVWVRVCGCGCG